MQPMPPSGRKNHQARIFLKALFYGVTMATTIYKNQKSTAQLLPEVIFLTLLVSEPLIESKREQISSPPFLLRQIKKGV